jgi:hypothetical protein
VRRFFAAFAFVCCLLPSVSATDDPLGSLIDSEQEKEQAWLEEPRDIPDVYLWGDNHGVEIDNPRAIDNPAALCSEIEYDHWIALSDSSTVSGDVPVNISSPQLRELLSDTCLVRPTDRILAVGKGWQKKVAMDAFVMRSVSMPCPQQFPYALWGKIETELPGTPLFYTTDLDFGENGNSFAAPLWIPLKNTGGDVALQAAVPNLSDYVVSISSLAAGNVDALYLLERRTVTLEDDDLPYQIVAWCKSGQCQTLWIERVSHKNGSGHVIVTGTLDFNGDGRRDLLLEGDNAGCPYRKIFLGVETGFSPMETPELACAC